MAGRLRSSLALTGTDAAAPASTRCSGASTAATIHDGGPAVVDTDGDVHLETRAVDAAGNVSAGAPTPSSVDLTAPGQHDTPAAPDRLDQRRYTVTVDGTDGARLRRRDDRGHGRRRHRVRRPERDDHRRRRAHARDPHHRQRRPRVRLAHRHDQDRHRPPRPPRSPAPSHGWTTHRRDLHADRRRRPVRPRHARRLATRRRHAAAVTNGQPSRSATDGAHTLTLKAVDGAGNAAAVTATCTSTARSRRSPRCVRRGRRADRLRLPRRRLRRHSPASPRSPTASTAAPGRRSPSGGTFAVAKGTVRVRALDVAGNQALTAPVYAGRAQGAGRQAPCGPSQPPRSTSPAQGPGQHGRRDPRRAQPQRHRLGRPPPAGRRPRQVPGRRSRSSPASTSARSTQDLQGRPRRHAARGSAASLAQGDREDARSR